ncbi:MAG: NrdH-redoxin [Thermotogae bacterium]|uniref:glutaredoxin family protein n=1 Tax=Kosmotoga sp. TaxID=1955248 RepID=UPI000F1EB554|nr:glutaredoxin family protein [Kosmotoga sp.]MBO8166705.1 glutaredoxin family protein [Kosmotoga sp.]RKX48873.1 MAG: NrdH-redoxin [Thermotogota bacterium]
MNLKITVYSTPSCPWCRKVKQYFKSLGIPFKDVDVSKNPKKAEEMYRKSGQMGVPVVVMGNQVIVGFDKAKIDRILGIS